MATRVYHYNVQSEKRYFLGTDHRGLYDLIALNGNIVSHTPAAIAAFIATTGKDFYIDPQTHAFQHATIHLKKDVSDPKAGERPRFEFKPSVVRLARERLNGVFAKVIDDDRPLLPEAFMENGRVRTEVVNATCERVADFQLQTMIAELDEEAKELIGPLAKIQPKFLVAPYFYLSPHKWKEWLGVNAACYLGMKGLAGDRPVYTALLVSKEAIRNTAQIVAALSEVKPDGILLWIDDQVEETLDEAEIRAYFGLLRQLRGITGSIFNSHGGYLSALLTHADLRLLDGVAHAMNYGEHRSIVPVGGGIPMAHFYLFPVHSRLRFADAAAMVLTKGWLGSAEDYRSNVCKCRQCQELLDEKGSAEDAFYAYGESNPVTFSRRSGAIVRLDYPSGDAKRYAIRHYLYSKAEEFREIQSKSLAELTGELRKADTELTKDVGEDLTTHLNTWASELQRLVN